MRTSTHNKVKQTLINILAIASLILFSYATAMAKEPTSISGTDLGSSRIKADTVKPISGTDLGSSRVKAEKVKPKKSVK